MPQVQIIEPTIRPQKQKIRVCAYARVSSNSDDQLNSFSAQVEYFTQLIQAHSDWEFIDIYADEGITGTRADKRDDFQRMMRDCRAGRIDRILVKSISRFGRNSADCIEAVRELKILGIAVAFEKEGIDTGRMTNEMYFSMYSAFSQEESTSIAKNMRKGAVMRMKNGTYRLSQAPYGYRLDEKGGLLIHPEEAKVVRKIFGDFLSGKSIREIANELAQAQVPKLKGNPVWSATGVSYILTNERYMGDELFQKRFTTDAFPFRKVKNRGEKSQFYAEDTHEAIVSPNVFRLAQELLKKKNQLHGRKKEIQTYTICLANPPFKGTIDAESINDDLKAVTNTKKTELLFLALFLRMLKKGGQCACIVPDGVLFGSSKAHKSIRKELVENHQLRAVISMPSGVFKPYAGVSTAVLVFTKTGAGGTENVWFYDMKADGFSLDDKRSEISENDIPNIIERFHQLDKEASRQRTEQSFFVPKQEIADNDYDLSINKYKKVEYVPVEYPSTAEIMVDLHELEMEITAGLAELEEML